MTYAESKANDWPIEILVGLRREELLSQGRHDAFLFALARKGDVSCLRTEIQEKEEKITNPPDHLIGPMKPNASPRVYQDGYLAGLKDALRIVEQANRNAPRDTAREPVRALTHAIAEDSSPYVATSEPADAAPSESAPTAE